MKSLRFGLKALEEKAKISVRLKSRFALTPSKKEKIKPAEKVKSYEHIYMGTNSVPAYIIKFSITDFKETDIITTSYNYLDTALYDSKDGHLYFATWQSPPAILKVRISDFTIVDTIVLDGFGVIKSGAIDINAGYAYFASGYDIIKLDLKTFSVVKTITVTLTYPVYESFSVIDSDAGYLYLSRYYDYAIIKIKLSDFTHVETLDLINPYGQPYAGVVDSDAGFAYFGENSFGEARIRRIRLSDFSSDGGLSLGPNLDYRLYSGAAIDINAGYAYFGTNTDPGKLLKIRLSDFTLTDTLILEPGENGLESIVIDDQRGFIYCITYESPGSSQSSIIKVRLSDFTRVDSTILSIGEWGIFDSVIV